MKSNRSDAPLTATLLVDDNNDTAILVNKTGGLARYLSYRWLSRVKIMMVVIIKRGAAPIMLLIPLFNGAFRRYLISMRCGDSSDGINFLFT